MRLSLVLLLSLLCTLFCRAQTAATPAERAKALNNRVDELLQALGTQKDSANYYRWLGETFAMAIQCDSLDALAAPNGKVNLRYRKRNNRRLTPLRPRLIDGGLYFYERHLNDDALTCFQLYLHSGQSPLFMHSGSYHDPFAGTVAYYAALLSYGRRDYVTANRFADLALRDSDMAMDAAEIKISCMKEMMRTPLDSSRYELALLELHDKAPNNSTYFHMLISFLSTPGHEKELEQFAADEIRKDSNNVQVLALLGEIKMRHNDLDGAATCLQRVCRLDTTAVKALFNLALCYGQQAQLQVRSKTDDGAYKQKLSLARDCMEQVARRDPQQVQVEWVRPLVQIYRALGDDKAAKTLENKVDHHESSK